MLFFEVLTCFVKESWDRANTWIVYLRHEGGNGLPWKGISICLGRECTISNYGKREELAI